MTLFRTFALLILMTVPAVLQAQSAILKGDQITDLLAGKTAIGSWLGVPYRQWFAEDGTTFFAQPDARTTRGQWRVDSETGAFESWWPSYGWDTYGLIMADGELYWLGPDAGPDPFVLVEGQHLLFPNPVE